MTTSKYVSRSETHITHTYPRAPIRNDCCEIPADGRISYRSKYQKLCCVHFLLDAETPTKLCSNTCMSVGQMKIGRCVCLFVSGARAERHSGRGRGCGHQRWHDDWHSRSASHWLSGWGPVRHWVQIYHGREKTESLTVQELCESRGGRPGPSVLTSILVSVDVKQYWTMLRHWSQLVPNMSTDIWGH